MAILDILMRYLHLVSAVLAVGGAFFLLICVPAGLKLIDEARRDEVMLKIRRAFKMTVHPAILFLIVTGAYNSWKLWPEPKNMGRYHMFWGPHLLLAIVVFCISLWLLAGKGLRANHRTWLKVNVVLMLLTILAASGARWSRLKMAGEKLDYYKKLAEHPTTLPTSPATPINPLSATAPDSTP